MTDLDRKIRRLTIRTGIAIAIILIAAAIAIHNLYNYIPEQPTYHQNRK